MQSKIWSPIPESGRQIDPFNTSLRLAKVSDIWKKSSVTPIYKNDKTNGDNYRPTSLVSSVGKAFEKSVHKHVHNFVT